MKKCGILLLIVFITGCSYFSARLTPKPKDNNTLIREACPPNIPIAKLYNSPVFGYSEKYEQIPGGYLVSWETKINTNFGKETHTFEAFVDVRGNVMKYTGTSYFLNQITGFLGRMDANGNITCY